MSCYKEKPIIVFTLITFLFLLSACASPPENEVLKTAWQTCESVNEEPIEGNFTGKTVLVWNLHPKMDYRTDDNNINTEKIGTLLLTDAKYFILGNYSDTKYYSEDYDLSDIFTNNLDSTGAFLCVTVKYNDIETCEYSNDFSVIRTVPEASIKLVSWPEKRVIAETQAVANLPKECSTVIRGTNKYKTDHIVDMYNIDIFEWLLNYKK